MMTMNVVHFQVIRTTEHQLTSQPTYQLFGKVKSIIWGDEERNWRRSPNGGKQNFSFW
jgi:hypothetical protein